MATTGHEDLLQVIACVLRERAEKVYLVEVHELIRICTMNASFWALEMHICSFDEQLDAVHRIVPSLLDIESRSVGEHAKLHHFENDNLDSGLEAHPSLRHSWLQFFADSSRTHHVI